MVPALSKITMSKHNCRENTGSGASDARCRTCGRDPGLDITIGVTLTRDGASISLPPGHYTGTLSGCTVTIPTREGAPLLLTCEDGIRGTMLVVVESDGTGTYHVLESLAERAFSRCDMARGE